MLTLIQQGPDLRLYRWHSLLVNVHWNEFRVEHFEAISHACTEIVEQHRQMSSIVVMRGEFRFSLDPEARRASAQLTKRWEDANTGQAIVVEADGFRASLARSLITGVNLLAQSRARQRVFKDAREATEWICALETQPGPVREGCDEMWQAFRRLLADLPS